MNNFDELLGWLHPDDREQAGRKYEEIRRKLIRIFIHRGCMTAEELADETIDRVTRKVLEIKAKYNASDDPALYFYGVARNVYREYLKRRPDPVLPPPEEEPEDLTLECECLERCLARLAPRNRELILEYYQDEEGAKIERRKKLAHHFEMAINALRIRTHRIRADLKKCVLECLKERVA
jgi:DNA-directed RNA polymerase specialized sigma24 family protein